MCQPIRCYDQNPLSDLFGTALHRQTDDGPLQEQNKRRNTQGEPVHLALADTPYNMRTG